MGIEELMRKSCKKKKSKKRTFSKIEEYKVELLTEGEKRIKKTNSMAFGEMKIVAENFTNVFPHLFSLEWTK